ncbi:MAG: dUTP diphosphatase [Paracoccaceae bacterium]
MIPPIRVAFADGADTGVPLPSYATSGAAGADIRANLGPEDRREGLVLAPGERRLVPSGLRLEIPAGLEVQIRPRSGLALRHGVTLANAPGTIDSDYRGILGIILVNLGADTFTVRHGQRIAQMVVSPVIQCRLERVGSLDGTLRGEGGFGSTGNG